MSNLSVHIALSDRGWVLETLAKKLSDALPYVRYDEDVDPGADIQYYMTYGVWRAKISPIEVAYFAHLERDKNTQEHFYKVANSVDYCTCHSLPYEKILRESGIDNVQTISPGVDLENFRPKVKIGIVGRTYKTGRKGEGLVAQVMDIPGIEWHFTGAGWPGPALNLRDDEMPAFYNAMDYILVPSLYEGGPMAVVEALACGCEVIAPPIGWVPEFPHIEYRTGDADDLRRVLLEVVEKRAALRDAVLARGWDNWVKGHDEVFQALGTRLGPKTSIRIGGLSAPRLIKRPALMVHGTERGTDKGGPSVRAPKTALRLSRIGYDAVLRDDVMFDQREHDLYHIYNIWHPKTCRSTMEFARLSGAPVVLSPIYLDLSEKRVFDREVPQIFHRSFSASMVNDEFARLRERKIRNLMLDGGVPPEPYDGFHYDVRGMVGMADHLICLSEDERQKLRAIGADVSRSTIVRNPVETGLYANADPRLFQEAFGVTDYVLCIGRLEARKNQITLLHALRDSGIPLVLVGHTTNPEYEKLLRSVAGPNAIFAGRIASNSAMLASAYAGARVFCLPSWSEGAPLVALEAAAAGCNMVLSDRSSEREYFGDNARYIDPSNPEQILAEIQEAYEAPFSDDRRQQFKAWVEDNFSWDKHIEGTAAVYERVAAEASSSASVLPPPKIYIDLTSSAHRSGPPSGIARVEERYAQELHQLMPGRVQFVLWNSHRRQFIDVTYDQFIRGKHKQLPSVDAPGYLFDERTFLPYGKVRFEPDSVLLVLGGAWIRNENYVHCLASTKRAKQLTLVAFIHDVIQTKFRQWFPDNVGDEFTANCRLLVDASDHVVVNSQCTLDDLRDLCADHGLVTPPIDAVRFGDEIDKHVELKEEPQFDRLLPLLRGRPFILCVSAIDIRKNHILLYNLWERMLNEYGDKTPNLIMIGSKGWNIDHFLEQVGKNEKIKKVFHILNGINDASLDWLYRNCMFTVYPSFYEGWGLPVAEALNYGKVCVAAKAGSVPEIAPDFTDLLDPLDFPAWYRVVTTYAFNKYMLEAREKVVASYRPVTWKESAKSLYDILENVGRRRRPLPELRVNQPLLLDEKGAKAGNSPVYMIGGWYRPEKRGTWTAGSLAQLQFRLRGNRPGPLALELEGYGFVREKDVPQAFEIRCDGKIIGEGRWFDGLAKDIFLLSDELSKKLIETPETTIELLIGAPTVPASIGKGTDKRQLGLMVASARFRPIDALPLDIWIDPRDKKDADFSYMPMKGHGPFGKESLKIALSLGQAPEDVLPADGEVYLGIRYISRSEKTDGARPVPLEIRLGEGWLAYAEAVPNQVETRIIPVSVELLKRGCLLSFAHARSSSFPALEIIEYGVFTSDEFYSAPLLASDVMLNCGMTPTYSGGVQGHSRQNEMPSASEYLVSGWSLPEAAGVWSDGFSAHISFTSQPRDGEGALLALDCAPYRAGAVELLINGGDPMWLHFTSSTPQRKYVPLSWEQLRRGRVDVQFRFPKALSPQEVEGSADIRRLGLRLQKLTLLSVDAAIKDVAIPSGTLPANTIVSVGKEIPIQANWVGYWGHAEAVTLQRQELAATLLAGWAPIESAGVWSDGRQAVLRFKVNPTRADMSLVLELRTYCATAVSIAVNGRQAAAWDVPPRHTVQRVLTLTPRDTAAGVIVLELTCNGAVSPTTLGESDDARHLGVFLASLGLFDQTSVLAFADAQSQMGQVRSPPPLVMDLRAGGSAANVEFFGWQEPTFQGRYAFGDSGALALKARPPVWRLPKVAALIRLDNIVAPTEAALLVNGSVCASLMITDSGFHRIEGIVPLAFLGRSKGMMFEVRINPQGAVERPGKTRLCLAGIVFVADEAVSLPEPLLPVLQKAGGADATATDGSVSEKKQEAEGEQEKPLKAEK